MRNILLNSIIIGIIFLLVGTTVIPANMSKITTTTSDDSLLRETAHDHIYNLIGGVNITFDYALKDTCVKIEWWKTPDRNCSYPIVNGNVSVNYTLKLQTYAVGVFALPRLASLFSTLFYDINTSRGSNGTSWNIVRYTDTIPGKEIYVTVETTHPFPTPPSDPGTNTTLMHIFSIASAFTIIPLRGYNEDRPYFIHQSYKNINITTSFYEP